MSKELEFLGKVKKLCEDYHFWFVPDFGPGDDSYLELSDFKDDSIFLNELIDFYSSDLPF